MKRILGIDPGLQRTGWGVIELHQKSEMQFIAMGVIKTNSSDDIALRLLQIFDGVQQIIAQYSPSYSAIEETYVNTNYATSLDLSQAKAASILAMSKLGIIPSHYKATVIKKTITNSGTADKQQILKMLHIWLKDFHVEKKCFDASDAVAIAICHSRYIVI